MIDAFLHGNPSIYDVSTALLCVLILVIQLSFHVKQIKDAREMQQLKDELRARNLNVS